MSLGESALYQSEKCRLLHVKGLSELGRPAAVSSPSLTAKTRYGHCISPELLRVLFMSRPGTINGVNVGGIAPKAVGQTRDKA